MAQLFKVRRPTADHFQYCTMQFPSCTHDSPAMLLSLSLFFYEILILFRAKNIATRDCSAVSRRINALSKTLNPRQARKRNNSQSFLYHILYYIFTYFILYFYINLYFFLRLIMKKILRQKRSVEKRESAFLPSLRTGVQSRRDCSRQIIFS